MRDIFKVLEQIKELSNDKEFLEVIADIENALRYKAPEDSWNYVYDKFIVNYIPPETDIDYKILSIWTTKSVDELKGADNIE